MNIGYLGVGRMSAPMIENLRADGHELRVWNRTADKAAELGADGVTPCADAVDVVEPGGLLISCLADDTALESVLATDGLLERLGKDGVHLSMSTISAACAARQAARHAAFGAHYLGVPILGRPEAVKARLQSFLIAGDRAAKARAMPVLEELGRKVFDFGDEAPAANVAKINFNFLIASAVESMAESFSVVEKSGLDPRAFYEMVVGTAFGCPLYEGYGRILVDQAWDEAGFRLQLGLKDVRLANETAADCDARMQLGELLEARFGDAVARGLGDKDWTAVAVDIRREAGLDS